MSTRQVIVLVIAGIAAIGALLIFRGMGAQRAQATATPVETIAGEEVLVAAHDIKQGAALAPGDLAVRLFPRASVAPQFISITRQPSAQADYVGAVTRRPFAQGEPIALGSVQQPDGHGFMAAQLEPGYRAVAIEINLNTSVGGFIQPNDHVDVLATASVQGDGGRDVTRSSIVLQDIRVLALNDVTQPQTSGDSPTRTEAQVAVLELTAEDARVLAEADGQGDISLALRGVQAETVGLHTQRPRRSSESGSGSVRVHAFGSVLGGGS